MSYGVLTISVNHRDADNESQGFVVGTSWVCHILAHLARTHNRTCGPDMVLQTVRLIPLLLYQSDLQTTMIL